MKYRIYFWHGCSSLQGGKDRELIDKLENVDGVSWDDAGGVISFGSTCDGKAYSFGGSLDDFARQYRDKFIVWPSKLNGENMICVTQHNNFGMR